MNMDRMQKKSTSVRPVLTTNLFFRNRRRRFVVCRECTGLAMPVSIWRIRPSSKKFTILPAQTFFKKSSSTTFFGELDICQRGTWKTPSVLLHPPARRSQHTPWRPLPSGCMREVATLRPKRAYPPHLYSITPHLPSRIGRTPPDGSSVLDQTFHPIFERIYNTIVDIVCLLLFSLIVY